ncbi:unnamed protein product [Penicillium roqueforti FM164]|uniref:Genomic scaffold, ProqFM164S01 n=1 Tax=Penicillium roqueforti (strain FM164) TaxID=1365484 RepID=W6Q054_PENRF|nr:unnamed protein product [Penicillium roqueforti FM164]
MIQSLHQIRSGPPGYDSPIAPSGFWRLGPENGVGRCDNLQLMPDLPTQKSETRDSSAKNNNKYLIPRSKLYSSDPDGGAVKRSIDY